jgi:hypothetical protein
MKIIWIDDNPDRESTAEDLGARFINVRGKDLGPVVDSILKDHCPDLFIIDHILDKAASETNAVFRKGSTIAEAIKAEWPSCPVLGVTNADKVGGIDLRTRRTYDILFGFHHFSSYFDRIKGIAKGFASVERTGSDVNKLIRLLRPPTDEVERLGDALSDDLKKVTQDASLASRMFRWVSRLMDRPCFLLDELWSATLVGLNEQGFAKVAAKFDGAKYSGVFSRPDQSRWWSSRLSQIVYELSPPDVGEFTWHVGRRLPGIKKLHFSSCYYCDGKFGDYPETVAFLDETTDERRAMHLRCTELHPRYQRELYFEDMRMMRGD